MTCSKLWSKWIIIIIKFKIKLIVTNKFKQFFMIQRILNIKPDNIEQHNNKKFHGWLIYLNRSSLTQLS